MLSAMIRLAFVLLLLGLGIPSISPAQSPAAGGSAVAAIVARDTLQDTTAEWSPSGAELPHKRKVSQPIGELRPVVELQWGLLMALFFVYQKWRYDSEPGHTWVQASSRSVGHGPAA
jgi:hypothetical protein